jgi:hypothetical protein
MAGAGFTTKEEAFAAVEYVRGVIERLPLPAMDSFGPAVRGLEHLAGGIHALALVDPADAVGTVAYRRVMGLPPIDLPTTEGEPE